jgi:plastocyanin
MHRSMSIAVGVLVLVACGGGDNGAGPGDGGGGGGTLVHAARVTATNALTFNPQSVSIPANDTIFFTFQDVQHNVRFTAATGVPADVPSTQSTTVKRQFTTAGTFNYHCSIHPQMTGTVTVTP